MQKSHNGSTINNPNILRVIEAPPSPSPPPITTANGGGVPACASCRHQRKKCTEKCILAPFFPAEKTPDFQAVHKIFGVSNVTKLVKGLSHEDGLRAVNSLIWEAHCRMKDPVLGPLGEYQRLEAELVNCKSRLQQANIEHQFRQVGALPIQSGVMYNNNKLPAQQCFGPYNNGDHHHNGINNGNSLFSIVGNGTGIDNNSRIVNYGLQSMDKSSLKPERDHQQHANSFLHSPQQMMNDFSPYHNF